MSDTLTMGKVEFNDPSQRTVTRENGGRPFYKMIKAKDVHSSAELIRRQAIGLLRELTKAYPREAKEIVIELAK